MRQAFGITVTSQMRHAALWKAKQKCGTQKLMAEKLGISQGEVGGWINLRRVPNFLRGVVSKTDRCQAAREANISRAWSQERRAELEKTLFELTGQTLVELFPPELCANEAFLQAAKQIEQTKTISPAMISHLADRRLILPSPHDVAEKVDFDAYQHKKIQGAMATLSYIEREIVKFRYGLGDGYSYTLEEVGYIFKVTRERIRQIERKALCKLRRDLKETLEGEVDEADTKQVR